MRRVHDFSKGGYIALALVLAIALLSVGTILDDKHQRTVNSERRVSTLKSAVIFSGHIKHVLGTNTSLIRGLSAVIATNPQITQQDYAALGRELLKRSKIIRNLGSAPDLVVRLMYPMEGNEAVIGLDYSQHPVQKAAALRARDAGDVVIAGPLELVQGGQAFIGRSPVFIPGPNDTQRFWGLVSAVIMVDQFLQAVGLSTQPDDIWVSLRGTDALGAEGSVFYGDASLFDRADILLDIDLPVGSWQMAAASRVTPGLPFAEEWQYRIIGGLLGLLSALIIVLLYRRASDRERAVRDQAETATLLHQATLLGNMGSWRYDIRTRRAIWSEEAYAIMGIPRNLPPGPQTLMAFLVEEDQGLPQQTMNAAALGEIEYNINYRVRHSSGEIRWVHSRASLIRDKDGQPESLLGMVQDITSYKTIEAGLVAARDEAQMANRSKSEFLANMSHELRTPLNAVIGLAEMMNMGVYGDLGTDKYREYVQDIRTSGQHLLNLINDILDLSRIESSYMELHEESLDLLEQSEEALHLLRLRMEEKGKTVELLVPADLPHLRADRVALRSMLLNLISNSEKFTGDSGRITLSGSLRADGGLDLWVADNGIGIPPDHIDSIAQPFRQVERAWTRSHEGSGLGLAITRSLLELHGGRLIIDSDLGRGTKVTLSFPKHRTVGPR
ncbi:ATP-binding protein [Magnetospira sp. QH-2]|uniref:ATP-binding protein n=1 Tax=Magnetospira sp. (strain QH-2) TaxID=1288970 RepID=UPI0003E80F55|nr:ATP-binding protein [Magnetospira sp. QH-2]CCQ74715.1 putative histidine kinase with CHASE domain and PAS sensor domain [Magnetospira sp. QH-2]